MRSVSFACGGTGARERRDPVAGSEMGRGNRLSPPQQWASVSCAPCSNCHTPGTHDRSPPELPSEQHRGDLFGAAAIALQQPLPAPDQGILPRVVAFLLAAVVVRTEGSSLGLNQHESL